MVTTINEAGLALIKKFEGLRLKAYKCAAGGKKLNGLIKRRAEEYNLYNTPVVNADNSYIVGNTYVISASGLNVRKEPTVTSEKAQKTSLKKGTKIVVEAVVLDTDGNTWLKISKGYIAAIYQGNVYVKEGIIWNIQQ